MINEFKCYGLHILQSDYNKVLGNEALVEIMEKYDAAAAGISKNPMIYCTSLLFKDKKTRDNALTAIRTIGINAISEPAPAYVDMVYVKPSWLGKENKE